MSLTDAAATGSRIAVLRALRERLAVDVDACGSARDVAALSQRLMDVLAQIDELGGGVAEPKKVTALDEFTQRRRTRTPA